MFSHPKPSQYSKPGTNHNLGEHLQIMKNSFTYKRRGRVIWVRISVKTDLTSKEWFSFYKTIQLQMKVLSQRYGHETKITI